MNNIRNIVDKYNFKIKKYHNRGKTKVIDTNKGKFVLKAENKNIKDITISSSDHFQIIGKVYI